MIFEELKEIMNPKNWKEYWATQLQKKPLKDWMSEEEKETFKSNEFGPLKIKN